MFRKLTPFFEAYISRYRAALAIAINATLVKFTDKRYYNKLVYIVSTRGLNLAYK